MRFVYKISFIQNLKIAFYNWEKLSAIVKSSLGLDDAKICINKNLPWMKISFKCREQVGQPCWKRYYIGDGITHTVTSIRNRKSMKISALQILRNFCFGIMSFMNILKIQLISHFKQVIRIMLLSSSFCYD